MIQQIGQSITFECFYTTTGVGATGLSVTVDVYNAAGSLVVSGGVASETGGGFYRYIYNTTSNAGDYRAIFKTSSTSVDQKHLPSLWVVGPTWVQNLDTSISSVAASVWSYTTRTLTAIADSAGITTLLGLLTSSRATKLDNLDTTISSRLAAASYIAPNNASITAIKANTDNLTAQRAANLDNLDNLDYPSSGLDQSLQLIKTILIPMQSNIVISDTAGSSSTDSTIYVNHDWDIPVFNGFSVVMLTGPCTGEVRPIVSTDGASEVTVDPPFSQAVNGELFAFTSPFFTDWFTKTQALNDRLTDERATLLDNLSHLDIDVSQAGQLAGMYSVSLSFKDGENNAIGNVFYKIQGVGEGAADANGAADISLNQGTYTLLALAQNQVVFPVTTFTVSDNTTVHVVGTVPQVLPPDLPVGTCAVRIQLANARGNERGSVRIVELPHFITGGWLVNQEFTAAVDSDGVITIANLPCSAQGLVTVAAAEISTVVTLPDTASVLDFNASQVS